MNENLFRALGTFLDAMRHFAVSVLMKNIPNQAWEESFGMAMNTEEKKASWQAALKKARTEGGATINLIDFGNLQSFAIQYKDLLAPEFGGMGEVNSFIGNLGDLRVARNKCQHFTEMSDDEVEHAFSNMKFIAGKLEMTDLREEILHCQQQ